MALKHDPIAWTIRIVFAGCAAYVLAYVTLYLEFMVVQTFMVGREFSISEYGVRWDLVLEWLPSIAIFGLAGVVISRIAAMRNVMVIAFMVGILGGFFRWSLTTIAYSNAASLVDKLLAHSINLVPLTAVVVVAFLSHHLRYLDENYP